MYELDDNLFNYRHQRHQPKLKIWRYAGLMLTYRCTAACRFCYYYCAPQAGGLMPTDIALAAWESLIRLAGERAVVHITGGEPFLYFDRLAEIAQQAYRLKLPGFDVVETNAQWGDNERDIAEKLKFLNAAGMQRLKISWDPFHEEFIECNAVLRLAAVARKVLGPQCVLIRWERYLDHPSNIRDKNAADKNIILQNALLSDRARFTGRAAETLGPMMASQSADNFKNKNCQRILLGAKGIHIDPYGNVFNGQCSGMAVGNITHTPLDTLWQNWQPDREVFWKTLFDSGPAGFLQQASEMGYQPQAKYASKCHLCTHIRRFFFDKGWFSSIITPNECYGIY